MKNIKINKYIDHTALKPDTTIEEIRKLCKEAREYNFKSVCINPSYIGLAKKLLNNTEVEICTVIGFPLGASTTSTKVFEANEAITLGATEIDMVINISALKNRDFDYVLKDIREVKESTRGEAILKVIIETCLLTDDEKVIACGLAKKAGADFVKTSTGFSNGGATKEDITLMRKCVGESMGVKASGGVRTYEDAIEMIEAGASRIGASQLTIYD